MNITKQDGEFILKFYRWRRKKPTARKVAKYFYPKHYAENKRSATNCMNRFLKRNL